MESLSEEELRVEILNSLPRMNARHRERLRAYFGGTGNDDDLTELVNTSPLVRERLNAFLRENPEALEALLPPPVKRNRLLPYIVAACALLLAVIPLIAQYEQQRALSSGPTSVRLTPLSVVPVKPVPRSAAPHAVARVRKPAKTPHVRRIATVAAAKPVQHQAATRHAPVRIAQRTHVRRAVRAAYAGDPKARRARAVVSEYLNQVIHGNIFDAPEASIVGPMSQTYVLSVHKAANGREKVDVAITGPHGRYYEVFYLARESMRIIDKFYTPE